MLTAHPTEVRRKSTLTRELEIADLLDERERAAGDPASSRRSRKSSGAPCSSCGAPTSCARSGSWCIDEVANGLSYYDYTFFREVPRLYGAIEDALDAFDPGAGAAQRVPSFLRIGSWIGGDRDGNPYVTADVLDEAMRQQSARALGFYLDELHQLGGELSLASRLARVSPALDALADRAEDDSLTRSDEPYRRAIAGMYSRLAKTARELDHVVALRQPIADAPAYASVEEFAADLAVIAESLERERRRDRRPRAPEGARCAPSTCSASTSRRSTCRQNSDVHERTVGGSSSPRSRPASTIAL